jgi:guanine deaminase
MDTIFARRAIQLGKEGCFAIKAGGPFGAVVVKEGQIVGEGYNRVLIDNDPTAHAEMVAIRNAAKNLGAFHLEGCTLYTSAYCCPMCLSASYWAHIKKIYHAAEPEDVKKYGEFEDVDFYQEILKSSEERKILSVQILREEALEVWKEYQNFKEKRHY